MAQLNDTMVQGDLRTTGAIYGTFAAVKVDNANLAIPMLTSGDNVGGTGDFFIAGGSGKNLPNTSDNFNIHTTVTHYTGTTYRLSQIATPTSSTQPTGIYERGGISSDGVSWTFSSWTTYLKLSGGTGSSGEFLGWDSADTAKWVSNPVSNKADSRCFHNERLDSTNSVTNFLKMTFSDRVGRSSALVAIAANNGSTTSLFMLSWFHGGSSIGNVKADLISCGDEEVKPLVYYSTDSIYFGIGNSGNIVSTISLMVSCENPSNISYSQVTRAVATASPNVNISLSRDAQLKSNLVTSLVSGNISDTYYPSSKAVDDSLKSISKCHVEALVVPVTPEQYGFVNVGLYRNGYSEPVFVPTTYDSVKDSYYIASGDFSALVYTYGVFNPTIVYGCEEFYVDYTWTGAITKSLSLYDFFTGQVTEYLRHFAFTINNYCGYALTLQIYGGVNKPDIDIYSNLRAMTNTLNVACAANRVTRIDVRLRNLGVNTSGAKSVVVMVT